MTPIVLISTQNIYKSYSNTDLFQDLSTNFHVGERTGLVGPNGAGKSSLLKILAGMESVDQGEISIAGNTRIAYLPQIDVFEADITIRQVLLQAIPDHLEEWEIQKRLNEIQEQVGFPDLGSKVNKLSGGWKKRVSIATILARDCDLILLDEPTNHLDLAGILWLEDLLKVATFAFILISHDRLFLENTCNNIMDLDRRYKQGYLKVRGNYSQFIQDREKYLSEQQAEEMSLSNKVRREIEWLRHGPKARTTKAQYRIDKAHDMISNLSDLQQRNNLSDEADIRFTSSERRSKKLLFARGLTKSRGGKLLFKDLEILLSPGMKTGIMGANGSGKSTLIEILRGQLEPDAGEIELGHAVRIITLDQSRKLPDENLSLRRVLAPDGDTVIYQGNPIHISAWAKRFLFKSDQLDLPVAQLSGGERARVLLANLMLKTADILILDEPTNDLDIPTLEVLEDSLTEFEGSLLLITHDRFLMDRVCDQILYLAGDGSVKLFADSYQLSNFEKSRVKNTKATLPRAVSPSSHKQRHEHLKNLRREFSKLERDIEKAEARVSDLEGKLNHPEHARNPAKLAEFSQAIELVNTELENLLGRWESTGSEIAEMESS
ncbi:MAG: ABC-F family ATP-binding cassette domain-containing protein [Candidatus Marinimicrobia bacterium]|nr:ABC-F family ATP-binding cassette domain-containing protein [Candidatus Neomarinimicrobiota bacterium]